MTFRKCARVGHDFTVPWSDSVSYSISVSRPRARFRRRYLFSPIFDDPSEPSHVNLAQTPQLSPKACNVHGYPCGRCTVPEQMPLWPEGRRQSCGHFLTCVSNHDAETERLLENRPLHPAKLSPTSDILGADAPASTHRSTVQIAPPPATRPAFFSR